MRSRSRCQRRADTALAHHVELYVGVHQLRESSLIRTARPCRWRPQVVDLGLRSSFLTTIGFGALHLRGGNKCRKKPVGRCCDLKRVPTPALLHRRQRNGLATRPNGWYRAMSKRTSGVRCHSFSLNLRGRCYGINRIALQRVVVVEPSVRVLDAEGAPDLTVQGPPCVLQTRVRGSVASQRLATCCGNARTRRARWHGGVRRCRP